MSLRNRTRVKPLVDAYVAGRYARRRYDVAKLTFDTGRHELLCTEVIISKKLLADAAGSDSLAHLVARSSYDVALAKMRTALGVPESDRFGFQINHFRPDNPVDPALEAIRLAKHEAIDAQEWEKAASLRDQERNYIKTQSA